MDLASWFATTIKAPLLMVITFIVLGGTKWTHRRAYARERFRNHRRAVHAAVAIAGIVLLFDFYNPMFHQYWNTNTVLSLTFSLCFVIWLYPKLNVAPGGLRIACGACGTTFSHQETWVCGHCAHVNSESMFEDCGKCGKVASVMQCPRASCSAPIIMAANADSEHPARFAGAAVPEPKVPKPDPAQDLVAQMSQERARREHEIVMARLDLELAQEKARQQALQEQIAQRTKKLTLEEDSEEHQNTFLKRHEITDAKIAEIKKKFRNNPEMRERAIESILAWRDKGL